MTLAVQSSSVVNKTSLAQLLASSSDAQATETTICAILQGENMRDDLEFNVELCELIKQYPALYDNNCQEYGVKIIQDKIWGTISENFADTTDVDCKERWKNIRSSYAKYKKILRSSSSDSAKSVKAYYLAPHLKFLDNYLKIRRVKRKYTKSNVNTSKEENSGDEDDDAVKLFVSPPHSEVEIDVVPNTTDDYFNKTAWASCDYAPEKKKCFTEQEDSDLSFLQSMLPDMKAMTSSQKRKFKIGILQLSNNILCDAGDTLNGMKK